MTRDFTKAQFRRALKKYGFEPQGFLGYYALPLGTPDRKTCVSALNAGKNRRRQLAYLLAETERERKRRAEEASGVLEMRGAR